MTISIKFNRDKITDYISNNNNCTCSIVYIEPKNIITNLTKIISQKVNFV